MLQGSVRRHVVRLARLSAWVLFVVAMTACARGAMLRGRIDGLRDVLQRAERAGAYRCAPRPLAIARANLEFAEVELAQGNPGRAEEHLLIAEPNARAAETLSPSARCAEQPAPPSDADRDGIPDDRDRCPNEPEDFDGIEDGDGCPEEEDLDGDGIADARDACPLDPEDADGYLDTDGCPERDNDLDTILDEADRCADEPEDPDGYRDDDGCPDADNDSDSILDTADACPNEPGPPEENGCPRVYQDVQVTATAIRINQQIHFEFNKAVIRPVSFPILNTVAQVMRDYPQFTVDVRGHTDSRGDDAYNMRLSEERADAVRTYLIAQGIDTARLTSRGYGESMPIESNQTNAGRAANRRVEFIRTDSGAQEGTP